MKLHKEGTLILIIVAISIIILSSISIYYLGDYGYIISIILLIIYGFVVWFFRNPDRYVEAKNEEVIAPVDGKVVIIKQVYEKEFLKKECIQLSIFMSPLNVHVCRYPVSGKVIFTKYHPGKFLVAWHEKSSELNERTTVVVQADNKEDILFRQIAGAVARRIVLYAKEGDQAIAGKEYGFIKFGSRVDIFLPLNTEILVKEGDVTRGGEQLIARLVDK